MALVVGSAGLGAFFTALSGGQPGTLLGVFLVAGTVVAALAVRPGAAHLIIPVPPLAYLAAAMAAGTAATPAGDMTRTSLAVSALQWIAHGFVVMLIATAVAIVITVVRRRAWSRSAGMRAR